MAAIDPPRRPLNWRDILYAIPVIGWIARDLKTGGPDTIYYLLAALLSLWAIAVMTWGLVALTVVAVAMVPIIFVTLILITWG